MKPRYVSLFAGGGGSSAGYKMAGFESVAKIEFNKQAARTLRANFPKSIVLDEDISKIDGKRLLGLCGLEKGELDVLDGSPPCQGFSMVGKRIVGDEKNKLFLEYVRIAKALKPKVVVMENVEGMLIGKMAGFVPMITKAIADAGYDVGVALLNAAHFGVPQARMRLIWIGVRKDLGVRPSFPKPGKKILSVKDVLPYVEAVSTGTFKDKRQPSCHPCFTITRGGLYVYDKTGFKRPANAEELMVLSSFPKNYKWPEGMSQSAIRSQIGNCVPPKLMAAIARHIKKEILGKIPAKNKAC